MISHSRQKPPEDNEVVATLIERIEKSLVGEYSHQKVIDQIKRVGAQRNDIRDLVESWGRRNLEPEDYIYLFRHMPRSARVWGGCY